MDSFMQIYMHKDSKMTWTDTAINVILDMTSRGMYHVQAPHEWEGGVLNPKMGL